MIWKNYSHLEGSHAFLSPSRYHWLRYSEDRLVDAYRSHERVALGSKYHRIASDLIKLSIRLPNTAASLNSFVNDAIGFRMGSEVLLYYSVNCYGTADAISFTDGILRIHDLKTGKSEGSIDQLLIYAGLFCLDYEINTLKELREIFLRIYHDGGVIEFSPSPGDLKEVVDKIIDADMIIRGINAFVL